MTDYTPSDAALAFAKPLCYHSNDDKYKHCALVAAFDAGAASVTYRQPERVLTTAAELDALPKGAVGRCGLVVYQRISNILWGKIDTTLRYESEAILRHGSLTLVYDPSWQPAPFPAPVLLTADDPRWRDGAKVRGEFADGTAVEGTLHGYRRGEIRYRDDQSFTYADACVRVYLIAAAPDPDADKRQAVIEVLHGLGYQDVDGDEAGQILEALRERGVAK